LISARKAFLSGPQAVEVIVADNMSTDDTLRIAVARGCKIVSVEKRVIGAVRNGGAVIATGEILCFADADFRIHPQTFNEIDRAIRSGKVVAGSTGGWPERWSLGIAFTFAFFAPLAALARMDIGVVYCRKIDFEEIGGYREFRLFAEDVAFLFAMQALGRNRKPR
jgi:glycosyltransferase involved in cell wall biosynthesis